MARRADGAGASKAEAELPLAVEAAVAVLQTMPWLQRVADEAVRTSGVLSASRVRMLMVLTEGSRRGSEIAERWNISRAAVAESAASLVGEGYLRRVADPDDGRAVRFELTAKGRRAMEKFGLATAGALAAHVGRLAPERQRALLESAKELLSILSGSPGEGGRKP